MKIAGNVKDSAFIHNGLHFPQMKMAFEKPPEAVLEGVISWWGAYPPDPPHSSFIPYDQTGFFHASYSPDDGCDHLF